MSQFLAMFAKNSNVSSPSEETQAKKSELPPTTTGQSGLIFEGLEIKCKKDDAPAKNLLVKNDGGVLPVPSSKGVFTHTEDSSYLPPKPLFKGPDNNQKMEDPIKSPENKGKGALKSEKSTVTKVSNNTLTSTLQHQKKEKNIENLFTKNLQSEPLKANEILTKELESYYKQYINFQLEEQSLLIKKKELQQEIEKQCTEIESKTKELEELTNKEEYKEAESLDLKLKGIKDLVFL